MKIYAVPIAHGGSQLSNKKGSIVMKKRKALLAVLILAAGLTACSNKDTQTDKPNSSVVLPSEEFDGFVLNPDELVLAENKTELFVNGENPTYDKENGCIIFAVEGELDYKLDDRSEIALSTEDDILVLEGELVTDEYPSLCGESGYYGAAIKFDHELTPGDYRFSINFSTYTIGFKCTVK